MNSRKYFRPIMLYAVLSAFFMVFSAGSFAQEKPIESIVVFGSSLSDTGNAFTLLSNPSAFGFSETCGLGIPANVPPYDALDDLLIPDGTYAMGGHHVTNGAVWIERFARGKGLSGSVRPALGNAGTKAANYAVGGARASDYPCRFNLADQLGAFLNDIPEPSDRTLVVIEMGSNDVRDVLAGGDPALLETAAYNIGAAVETLYGLGARKFLLVNVPNIGRTPAVTALDAVFPGLAEAANGLSIAFNGALSLLQTRIMGAFPGIDVRILDFYALLEAIIGDPAAFGLENTQNACVTPNLPPFKCPSPDTYLFWDGIHPTKAVHDIMAEAAAEVLQ